MIELKEPAPPAFLKIGFFGETGSGKTYTAAKVLSQFIREYEPDKTLAFFDTEPASGYVAPLVKEITGRPLLAVHSRSFGELVEFTTICRDRGYVALLDSATHPWRALCDDFLTAKRGRMQAAGGNPELARLTLKDWGPIKESWQRFSERYSYDSVHWCMNGREGIKYEWVTDEEGKEEQRETGKKMKTETETGYEPSLLVQMRYLDGKHYALVVKDRFDALTGMMSGPDPDIEFFRPHIERLAIGGKHPALNPDAPKTFGHGVGMSLETISVQRAAILEDIKDDILQVYPGQTAAEKKAKVEVLRAVFGTSAWTALENDMREYPVNRLREGRSKLAEILKTKMTEIKGGKDAESE